MVYPLLVIAFGFASGIAFHPWIHFALDFRHLLSLFGGAALPLLAGRKLCLPVLFIQMVLLGSLCLKLQEVRAPHDVSGFGPLECASLEGIVMDLPAVHQRGKSTRLQYVLRAERILHLKGSCPQTGMTVNPESLLAQMDVSSAEGRVQVFLVNAKEIPDPGDRVRIFGRLTYPRPALNPGEMDYKNFLAQKKIGVIFSGMGTAAMRTVQPHAEHSAVFWIHRVRKRLSERIEQVFEYEQGQGGQLPLMSPVMKGLLLGINAQIPQVLWTRMIKTGTAHIISISGLHLTMITTFFFLIFIALRFSQKQAALISTLMCLFYMGIAGFGVPIQRSALMSAAAFTAVLLGRESRSMNLFAFASFLILLKDPLALGSVSFQLSFLSVFSLLILSRRKAGSSIGIDSLNVSFAVLAGTLPVAAYHFHLISWVACVANLWAIPFFNNALLTGLVLLAFAKVPFAGHGLAKICEWNLKAGLWGIQLISKLPIGYTYVAQPDIPKILLYYLMAVGTFFLPRLYSGKVRRVTRSFFLAGWCLSAVSFFLTRKDSDFSVTLLAVSRKILIHIRRGHEDWLVNAGSIYPADETRKILIPYLRCRGICRLEGVVMTGGVSGKFNALARLLEEVDIKAFFGASPFSLRAGKFSGASLSKQLIWKRLSMEQGVGEPASDFKIRALFFKERLCALEIRKGTFVLLLIENWDAQMLQDFRGRYQNNPDLQCWLALFGSAARLPDILNVTQSLKEILPGLRLRGLILPERTGDGPAELLSRADHVYFTNDTGATEIVQKSTEPILSGDGTDHGLSFLSYPYISK